ncbi:MAG: Dipeptide transport system permease protein DppB [Anaerolineales bacterium]|nr:Dipeptide transport system permease protein DppB [Anaerolineales bacterium]
MINYLVRRILFAIVVLIGISMVSFIVIQLPPGDFATLYKQRLINQAGMSAADAEAAADVFRERYGLDEPIFIQYLNWVKGIVTEGSFGYSMAYSRDVGGLIAERLPRTILLALLAHGISTVVGVIVGIYIAPRQYSLGDNVAALIAFIFTSVPRFWVALVIIYLLVFTFGQQHVSSFFAPQYALAPWSWPKLVDFVRHIWPIVLIAGLGGVARNMRVMRGNLLDVLNAQYVTTARSKGLTETKVMYKHAVPNALHPIVMYQGMVLPYMVQGELEAAIVMSIPTVSPMFYDSLINQDIYITGSILLMYGVMLVIGNILADVFLAVLDPRIRYT